MSATLGPYLVALRRHLGTDEMAVGPLLGALAHDLSRVQAGEDLTDRLDDLWPEASALPTALRVPVPLAAPGLLGSAYEALSRPEERRRGLHYTPAPVALRLAEIALDGMGRAPTICDPACGGGAFLLAAGEVLERSGRTRREIVDEDLVGIDLDPVAVAVATSALLLWCGEADTAPRVRCRDALAGEPWSTPGSVAFDLVLGNPPFQSQLGAATARGGSEPAFLRTTLESAAGAYTDTSALFLLAATENLRPDGRVVLIQPQSVLASRDTGALRAALVDAAPLEGLWLCDEPIFEANTRVCAPMLRCGLVLDAPVRLWRGRDVEPISGAARPDGSSWASLAAGLRGVPLVALDDHEPLSDLVEATAGFRREFYGLVPYVHEATGDPAERPLVTSGLIEPGSSAWGRRSTRFAKHRWQAPVVDLAGLEAGDSRLSGWVSDRLTPKVLIATQTRVVEAVADPEGRLVPSTPVISVAVEPARLWHLLAALLAPPVTAWALHLSAGTALSPDAVKLSARQVRRVPRPSDDGAWDLGAGLAEQLHHAENPTARRDTLLALGTAMVAAYPVAEPEVLLRWWVDRLPALEPIARSDKS